MESNYRNHRFPYIKTIDLEKKAELDAFKNGDIVALTTNIKNLDVTHMGLVIIEDGEPHLLHASSTSGEVVVSKENLAMFMKKNRNATGLRVIRLKD
jgi:hypothetical protein